METASSHPTLPAAGEGGEKELGSVRSGRGPSASGSSGRKAPGQGPGSRGSPCSSAASGADGRDAAGVTPMSTPRSFAQTEMCLLDGHGGHEVASLTLCRRALPTGPPAPSGLPQGACVGRQGLAGGLPYTDPVGTSVPSTEIAVLRVSAQEPAPSEERPRRGQGLRKGTQTSRQDLGRRHLTPGVTSCVSPDAANPFLLSKAMEAREVPAPQATCFCPSLRPCGHRGAGLSWAGVQTLSTLLCDSGNLLFSSGP